MNQTVYIILYLSLQLLFGVIPPLFFNSIQTPKIKPVISFFIQFAILTGLFFTLFFTDLKEPLSLLGFLSILLSSLFLYKEKFLTKVGSFLIFLSVFACCDFLTYGILRVGLEPSTKEFEVISTFVCTLFTSIFLALFAAVLKSRKNIKSKSTSLIFLLIPICQTLLIYVISLITFYEKTPSATPPFNFKPESSDYGIIIVIFTSVCLIVDIFAFRQYVKNIDAAKLEADVEALEYKNELNYNYFNSLKENEMELREIKHDLGGALEIVKELIYKEGDTEKAKVLFDELSEAVQNIQTGFYCKNSLINAILLNKAKTCKEKGIEFRTEITLIDNISIEDADLCRALVNMLDNAIEAAEQIEDDKKFVKIDIKTKDEYLFIKTENPYSKEFDISETSKENKKDHGYGLQILNGFSEKYNGNFSVTNKNNTVVSLLSMQNN